MRTSILTTRTTRALAAAAAVAILAACGSGASADDTASETEAAPGSTAETAGFAIKSNVGPVMFSMMPRGIEDGRFLVDMRVNTHSGDLSELDMSSIVRLKADGREYAPVEATPLHGHHARGRLAFELVQIPEEFEMTLEEVRDMSTIRFQWP